MKTLLVIGWTLLSFSALAEFPEILVKDFAGNYQEPSGSGQASYLMFGGMEIEEPSFTVEKQAGSLYIEALGQSFEIEEIPQALEDLDSLVWSDINLTSEPDKISLSVSQLSESGTLDGKTNSLDLRGLSANCLNKASDDERNMLEEILDSCLNNSATINLNSVNIKKEGKETAISGVSVNAQNNSVSFSLKMSGVKAQGNGNIYYQGDRIRVKVSKIKAGIFTITKKVFQELEKMQNEKFIVNRPWIEIILKEEE